VNAYHRLPVALEDVEADRLREEQFTPPAAR
jgi:hypothetical protein